MAATYVIKCYKCKTRFEGPDFDRLISDNNIRKDGRGYYCDCKVIVDIASEEPKKRGRKSQFNLDGFMS